MRCLWLSACLLSCFAALAAADPCDLSLGVLIAHAPPNLEFSIPPPRAGWCSTYRDGYAIDGCSAQRTRVDAPSGSGLVWFVLAAWEEEKLLGAVEFGFATYDEAIFGFLGSGSCGGSGQVLELSTPGWPGPYTGTAIVNPQGWRGNFIPVYWFAGYVYGEGQLPLGVNPQHQTASMINACSRYDNACGRYDRWDAGSSRTYPVTCLGALGLNCDGWACCPDPLLEDQACCLGSTCEMLSLAACDAAGGVGLPGAVCDAQPCPPIAACCAGEQCTLTGPEACAARGGSWRRGASTCTPNPCVSREIHLRADGTGDYATIQDAIAAAAPGSVILLADGAYRGPGNRDLDFGGRDLTLRSESGKAAACVIDCQGSAGNRRGAGDRHRALLFDSGEGPGAVVQGITVTGGFHSVGGAVWCREGVSPTFKDCVFADNAAVSWGGAVWCDQGSVSFTGCRFARNQSEREGGALGAGGCARVCLRDCVFAENSSGGSGAGVWLELVDVAEISGCTFVDHAGRALSATCQELTVTGTTFERNLGGAMSIRRGITRLEDVVCRDNRGSGGTALSVSSATMYLGRVRFTGNHAEKDGGAIWCGCTSTLTVDDVVLAGNSATRGGAILCERLTIHATGPFTIASNSATEAGGGIFVGYAGSLDLEGATLHANRAPNGSGIAFDGMGGALDLHGVLISGGVQGSAVWLPRGMSIKNIACCDIWGNEGGDWVGRLEPYLGTAGNISADPRACTPVPEQGPFGLEATSPCAPGQNAGCGRIGGWPVGCGESHEDEDPADGDGGTGSGGR